ncbi:MAG TPA: preprotein translocase subunit SecY [Candidatus Limnocylindrales bacterium]|nr:preprotein translocase subunit SecY [Candidatus Limnocylindrales bacterium]
MFEALINAFRAPDIRRRILFVLGMLVVYRALAVVPVPAVDQEAVRGLIESQTFLQLLDLFSGGGLSSFSIVAMGVNPYINASIIMQLMTGVVPRLQALSREGEYGRTRINQYTRYLTVPLALLQAYGYLAILSASQIVTEFDILSIQTIGQMVTLAAGTVLAMWIGELITERGIGNGISFIIFAGIVARVPQGVASFLSAPDIAAGVAFVILAVVVVAVIVYIQEGQRRIPIQYASRVRGRRMYQGGATFLPLRVNQAGVIPIIFAVSILLFPTQIASYFATPPGTEPGQITLMNQIADGIVGFLNPNGPAYVIGYFLLTMGFTYFYTAFTFKPDETADQLRKNGGFIPGIRPGAPTRDYLAKVVFRLSLAGAIFLALIAVSPIVLGQVFQGGVVGGFALGGTALLIVVSVVVETMKQIEAQLMMRNYEGFIR